MEINQFFMPTISQVIIFPNNWSWYSYYSSFPNTLLWKFVYLRDNLLSALEGIEILKRVKVCVLFTYRFLPFCCLENCKACRIWASWEWLVASWKHFFFSRFLIWVSMSLKGQDLNLLKIAKRCKFVFWTYLASIMSIPWNKFLNIYQFCSNYILLETKLHLLEAFQSFPIWR